MTQPTLDDIKDSIPHENGCHAERRYHDAIEYQQAVNRGVSHECNCTRRDKIALLERLQEPTEGMVLAALDRNDHESPLYESIFKAMLKAAEEAK